jgi:hypothetical protein
MISELVTFKAEHVDYMDLRDGQCIGDYKDNIKLYETTGLAYSLIIDNVFVCCAGVVNCLPKVGECWLIASKDFEKYYITITRAIKRFFYMVDPFYQRLQMNVRTDFKAASKYAEYLGFEREGTMRKLDLDGNDFYLYGRVV